MKGPPWIHHSRSDLELIIQRVEGRHWQGQYEEDRVFLRVVAGAEFLVCRGSLIV
jgi:hypothetical protein